MPDPVNPEAALYAAIARMQASVGVAIKDATGQVGQNRNYTYADLASVWEAARLPLKDNDLALVQLPGMFEEGRLSLTTIIVHKDGGSLSGTMSMPVPQANPQGCGSAITYMRRYAMCAALGIIQDDDDGSSAGETPRTEQRTTPPNNNGSRPSQRVEEPLVANGELTQEGKLRFMEVFKKHGVKMSEASLITGFDLDQNSYPQQMGQWLTENPGMTLETLALAVKEAKGN